MSKKALSINQKKANTDIWIIIITTLIVLTAYSIFQSQLNTIIKNPDNPILLRVFLAALIQYGVAGLGITIVCIFRKESFLDYGLNTHKLIKSIVWCALCFVPYTIFAFASGQSDCYLPFQSVWTTKDVLSASFPYNIIGITITAIAWGFFEGFNYVVICEKLNIIYPSGKLHINYGALICAVMCLLIHGIIGVTAKSIIEMITVIIIIYGMLTVKERTGNAWGCVFIFVLLWNAI